MLNLIPEWIEPTEITAPSFVNSKFLLIMLCRASIIFAEIKIGSILFQGCDPWAGLPLTSITKRCAAAINPFVL